MNAAPVERRSDPERIASLEAKVEGLKEWVQTIDVKVDTLTASFHIGSTKLDQILEKLKESAQERKEQREEIQRLGDEQRRQGEEVRQHMRREEAQMSDIHNEIIEGDTRVMGAFLQANVESKADRASIWGTVKKFHGEDAAPKKGVHWADQLLATVREKLFGLVGTAIAVVLAGYLVLGLNDMSAALKAVSAKVERVSP